MALPDGDSRVLKMRGRPPLTRPSRPLKVHLDEELAARMDLELVAPLEGKVPWGAYQRFLNERLREYFLTERLDLASFVSVEPGTEVVRGSPEAIERLKTLIGVN